MSRCGYGLIRQQGSAPKAVKAGVIRTSPQTPLPERLLALREELRSLMEESAPDAVAVERVLFQVNVRTAMGVGQASGIALVEAAALGYDIAEYSPNQVKQTVAGYGGATKDEMAHMIKLILKLEQPFETADVSDALAVALCHLAFCYQRQPLLESEPEPASKSMPAAAPVSKSTPAPTPAHP